MASNTRATHLVDWPTNSDPRGRLRSQRVNSSAQLALMVHHLSAKSWFDFNRFAHFLTTNHNAEAC